MSGFPYKIIIAYVILECVNDTLHTSYIVGVTLSSFLELLDALNLMLGRTNYGTWSMPPGLLARPKIQKNINM